ncbi:MAG TPA: NADH-quinone oxidoreductase subunit N [Pirellulales bacterium]|nr:NADH-quinone oxidoreductase subunit N [Pirellulales bacterium]
MDFLGFVTELVGRDGAPGKLADWCAGFAPELVLCATIVVMLLVRLPGWGQRINAFYVALVGALIGLYYVAPWTLASPTAAPAAPLFDGLLINDSLTVFFRSILFLFLVLFLIFTRLSGIPDREDSPDFYTLVLGGTIGMCLMASANHLLTVFLGVEMASVPSYALAGILKGRRQSSEAALKYSVYGAGTAGVMLYGISLLAGALGTCHLPTIAHQLLNLTPDLLAERHTVLLLGGLMVAVGLSFKLSAFPFHFWCPDVFEGASAEVNAFLSVASKAAALALLARVAIGFTHAPGEPASVQPMVQKAAVVRTVGYRGDGPASVALAVADEQAEMRPNGAHSAIEEEVEPVDVASVPRSVRRYVVGLIALLAALTCTFGNLAAYNQSNIKRLLAYSTIAHAGYMMMPVAAAIQLSGENPAEAGDAIAALAFYVSTYLFTNLAAFAIVAFLRNTLRSEQIADYAGLIRRSPFLVICFATILISLIGLPPLAGFAAKFLVFGYLVNARLYVLLVIGGLNTALSLFYYLRVVKVMTIDPEPEDRLPANLSLVSPAGVYLALLTIPVVVLGIWFDGLNNWTRAATQSLFM